MSRASVHFALVLVWGLFGLGTEALACQSQDLRPQLGPPRNQGDTGWCFAHTTADLISHRTGMRVSAFDVAATYIMGDERLLHQNNNPEIQNYLRENPRLFTQIERDRVSEQQNLSQKNILTTGGLYNIGGIEDQAAMLANIKGLCLDQRLPSGEKAFTQHLRQIQQHHRQNPGALVCDENSPMGGGLQAFRTQSTQVAARSFQNWVDQKCAPRVASPVPLVPRSVQIAPSAEKNDRLRRSNPSDHARKRAELEQEINRALDQGRPLAVGLSAYDLETRDPGDNDRHGDHSVVIAARKLINGKCHYFVRNSRGADCSVYLSRLRRLCEKEQGGLWVSLDQMPTLYSAVSLK